MPVGCNRNVQQSWMFRSLPLILSNVVLEVLMPYSTALLVWKSRESTILSSFYFLIGQINLFTSNVHNNHSLQRWQKKNNNQTLTCLFENNSLYLIICQNPYRRITHPFGIQSVTYSRQSVKSDTSIWRYNFMFHKKVFFLTQWSSLWYVQLRPGVSLHSGCFQLTIKGTEPEKLKTRWD